MEQKSNQSFIILLSFLSIKLYFNFFMDIIKIIVETKNNSVHTYSAKVSSNVSLNKIYLSCREIPAIVVKTKVYLGSLDFPIKGSERKVTFNLSKLRMD